MLTPPFTTSDLMGAARAAFMLEANVPREHNKPRASGIGSCARQQAYSMANAGVDRSGPGDDEVTTEQGRVVEDITKDLIAALGTGLHVINSQIELPADFPMTGHPDGELGWEYFFSPHTVPHEEWNERGPDGMKWGFEHKHLGRWAYEEVFKRGFDQGEPGYMCQTISYGMALGWDAVVIVVLAQDASSTRSDARTNISSKNPAVRWANRPDWNPKMLVYAYDLRPFYGTLGKRLVQRAEWLTKWHETDGEPSHVAREANPDSEARAEYHADENGDVVRTQGPPFPCGWCPWLERCRLDGDGGDKAPELPFKLMKEA